MGDAGRPRQLVFLDTETTSLDPLVRQPWEVGLIVRDFEEEPVLADGHGPWVPARREREWHWFIDATWLDWEHAEREALEKGGFHDRYDPAAAHAADVVLDEVWEQLQDATVVGSNPHFDLSTLSALSRRYALAGQDNHAPWHYRAVDVTSMAMPVLGSSHPLGLEETARRLGLSLEGRRLHSALGDARLARDVYDQIYARMRADMDDLYNAGMEPR